MSLLAKKSVGLIDEIRSAAEILRETINGAELDSCGFRRRRRRRARTATKNLGTRGHEKSAVNLRDF